MAISSSNFKKTIVDSVIASITSNTERIYAVGAHPVANDGDIPDATADDYNSHFLINWSTMFGKKIANSDIVPVINNTTWTTNTVYTRHDDTNANLTSSEYYVRVEADELDGYHHIFKCIDNANGAVSTDRPDQLQSHTFEKDDGYKWRYIYSVSAINYRRFATDNYIPVFSNATSFVAANLYTGVEVVMIENHGNGYNSYHNGTIQSNPNSTLVQVESNTSIYNDFYKDGSIYIYNVSNGTGQIKVISGYISNSAGNWIVLEEEANTEIITPGSSLYRIGPQVLFDTDGIEDPQAYCLMNTISNSIANVVILSIGEGITRANVSIVSNTGSGANVYGICPPPGGHGFNPFDELDIQGLSIHFNFANSESNTIPTNLIYNKVGLIRNPYELTANAEKGTAFSGNTFDNVLKATVSPATTFTVGAQVAGNTSGAIGLVCFANSTTVYLTGDKTFEDGEYLYETANVSMEAVISITDLGDIYTKDLHPLYYQNISDAERDPLQTESFKIIMQV